MLPLVKVQQRVDSPHIHYTSTWTPPPCVLFCYVYESYYVGEVNVLEGEGGKGPAWRGGGLCNNILVYLTQGRAISLEDGLQGHAAPPPSPLLLHYLALSPLDIKTTEGITPSDDREKAKSNLVWWRDGGGGRGWMQGWSTWLWSLISSVLTKYSCKTTNFLTAMISWNQCDDPQRIHNKNLVVRNFRNLKYF